MPRADAKEWNEQFEQVLHELTEDHKRVAAEREQASAFAARLNEFRRESQLETLRSAGVDVHELEKLAQREVQQIHKNLADFRKSTTKAEPDPRRQRREAILRRAQSAGITPQDPQAAPPISECWASPQAYYCSTSGGPNVQCIRETSTLEIKDHSTGAGGSLGIWAFGSLPTWGFLLYAYLPPVNGRLYVSSFPWLRGDYYLESDDHWWSSTEASLNMTMRCRIWNLDGQYEDAPDSITVIDESISDGTIAHTIDTVPWLQVSTNAVANRPVIISVEAELDAIGRSDYAVADADFFSGAERYIRVAYIWWTLWPD
jgi:hypothetical protein